MRYSELYLDDVTECQGDLFVLAVENKYDLISLVRFFISGLVIEPYFLYLQSYINKVLHILIIHE